ncbi:MAG: chromosomal replication initiator protein DnaA [bacterium]|nr:chromosomal replication initiator protein DnaA [bacterium]
MVDTIWVGVRRELRGRLAARDYETWIAPLRAASWGDGTLTIEAPTDFAADWVRGRHLGALSGAVTAVTGEPATVRIVVNRALQAPPPPDRTRRPPRRAEPADGARTPPPRYSFETFVVGASNRMAYEGARALVERPGRFTPFFLHGGTGLGKTHLLMAVAHALGSNEGSRVLYLTAEGFVNEMVEAIRRRQMERFRARFRNVGTLIVDDVQFLAGKTRSQEEFGHTFKALHDGRRQIVLASDRAPQDLPGIDGTLRSRFASGLMADVQPPDAALRVALVGHKATALGLRLDDDVVDHLAAHWCGNGRELEGVLLRLDAVASVAGRPITMALVEDALAPYARRRPQGPTIAGIVGEVCRHFDVSEQELVSAGRTRRVVVPRQVAMWLCRQHTQAALTEIGQRLGGRDHATVLHALAKIEQRLASDAELRETIARLAGRVGS